MVFFGLTPQMGWFTSRLKLALSTFPRQGREKVPIFMLQLTCDTPTLRFCRAGREKTPTRADIVCFWDVLISIFTASELFVGG